MGSAKCSVCGRMYSQSGLLGDSDKGIQFMASMVKKPICPDCKRASKFSGGNDSGGGNASRESEANAKLAEAQAKAIQAQAEAEAKAREMAADAAFASTMTKFTFNGTPEEIAQDFESIYQYWLKKDLKKDQKKVVADKLELGLMALKKADNIKGEFYENKVVEEKKKRKTMKIVKIVGGTVGIIAALLLLLIIGIALEEM